MIDQDRILSSLPYSEPFLFVDKLIEISDTHILGEYTFSKDSYFYRGHFTNHPVTPGVILTECMAQIGLACLGIHLLDISQEKHQIKAGIALSETQVLYSKPVYPGEKVTVKATKVYFRMNKLKSKVLMYDSEGKEICRGELSGVLIPNS